MAELKEPAIEALVERCDASKFRLDKTCLLMDSPAMNAFHDLLYTVLENQVAIMTFLAEMEPIKVKRKGKEES